MFDELLSCYSCNRTLKSFCSLFTALKLFTSLGFLLYEIYIIIDCGATPTFTQKDQIKLNITKFDFGSLFICYNAIFACKSN